MDLIGCATLTLPRYGGFRSGELRVDDGSREAVTNVIPREMSWPDQWRLACDRLEQLKRGICGSYEPFACAFAMPSVRHSGGMES